MQVLVPQVPNLNGTSKQALVDGYSEIIGYIRSAMRCMQEHAPCRSQLQRRALT